MDMSLAGLRMVLAALVAAFALAALPAAGFALAHPTAGHAAAADPGENRK
jgi:hypothetical protein